jgi:small RNA 2'-O-methyltransferase
MVSSLHRERIERVQSVLEAHGVRTVLDLGCGDGPLLLRLAHSPGIDRVVGVDHSAAALDALRRHLDGPGSPPTAEVRLVRLAITELDERFARFDAAVLLESLEHVPPERLSQVETAVFVRCRPGLVVMTTPNRECNEMLGVPAGRFRDPDHRFEWPRDRFRAWAEGVAARNGYRVAIDGIGHAHPWFGSPTQMATFVAGTAADGGVAAAARRH